MVNDILLNADGDFDVSATGDLVVGFSDNQHFADLLIAEKGWWKQSPLAGIGGKKYINAPVTASSTQQLKKDVRIQLEADGARVDEVATDNNWNVRIKGEYPTP